jgi:hypothetical protein
VIVVDGGGVELVEDEDDVEPLFSSILLPALIGLVDEGPHSVAIH